MDHVSWLRFLWIFISAVTVSMRSGRQLAANTLSFLVTADLAGYFRHRDRRPAAMLRQQVDQCKGLQMFGNCYAPTAGARSAIRPGQLHQYERLRPRARAKKVWYLFLTETFPVDACEPEPAECAPSRPLIANACSPSPSLPSANQSRRIEPVSSLRDDLVRLRRGVKQWRRPSRSFS